MSDKADSHKPSAGPVDGDAGPKEDGAPAGSSVDFAAEGPTLMWNAESLAEAGVRLPPPSEHTAECSPLPATQPRESSRGSFEIDPTLLVEEDTGAGLRPGTPAKPRVSGPLLAGVAVAVAVLVASAAALLL